MTWHIVAIACMINNPSECWLQSSRTGYVTEWECTEVLQHPLPHIDEVPEKVEGSYWSFIACREERSE